MHVVVMSNVCFPMHLCQLYVLKIWLLSRHHVRSEGFLLISASSVSKLYQVRKEHCHVEVLHT